MRMDGFYAILFGKTRELCIAVLIFHMKAEKENLLERRDEEELGLENKELENDI